MSRHPSGSSQDENTLFERVKCWTVWFDENGNECDRPKHPDTEKVFDDYMCEQFSEWQRTRNEREASSDSSLEERSFGSSLPLSDAGSEAPNEQLGSDWPQVIRKDEFELTLIQGKSLSEAAECLKRSLAHFSDAHSLWLDLSKKGNNNGTVRATDLAAVLANLPRLHALNLNLTGAKDLDLDLKAALAKELRANASLSQLKALTFDLAPNCMGDAGARDLAAAVGANACRAAPSIPVFTIDVRLSYCFDGTYTSETKLRLYHYTCFENAQKISKSKMLMASSDTERDAHFGTGVYASPFEPLSKTKEGHIRNNYGARWMAGRQRFADWVVIFEVPTEDAFRIQAAEEERIFYKINMPGGTNLYLPEMVVERAVCKEGHPCCVR